MPRSNKLVEVRQMLGDTRHQRHTASLIEMLMDQVLNSVCHESFILGTTFLNDPLIPEAELYSCSVERFPRISGKSFRICSATSWCPFSLGCIPSKSN
jgi:hypothetical protein